MSPYLFLSIIKGLVIFVLRYKGLRSLIQLIQLIQGVKVTSKTHLTHLLFVDGVMMFGVASLNEWRHYKDLFHTFCKAFQGKISDKKICSFEVRG
jgi:hypothetical protein